MAVLKNKSEFNIDSAQLLISNTYHAPSVHCSYYSCVQLMKYAVKKETRSEYVDIETEWGNSKTTFHTWIINKIHTLLKTKQVDSSDFQRNIGKLKQWRVQADYSDLNIDSTFSDKAINLAKEIIQLIKQAFSII
jgi:hypothetical protein